MNAVNMPERLRLTKRKQVCSTARRRMWLADKQIRAIGGSRRELADLQGNRLPGRRMLSMLYSCKAATVSAGKQTGRVSMLFFRNNRQLLRFVCAWMAIHQANGQYSGLRWGQIDEPPPAAQRARIFTYWQLSRGRSHCRREPRLVPLASAHALNVVVVFGNGPQKKPTGRKMIPAGRL